MRKNLIKLLLLCMIFSCLSSGTLAVYSTSIELENAVAVTAKNFYIGVNSANDFNLLLAPGESSYNEFTITNVDDKGMPTEVDMSLTIGGDFRELYQTIPGIHATLTEVGNPDLSVPANEDGVFSYTDPIGFHADEKGSRTFRMIFSWETTEANQVAFAGKHVDGITLYVTGTQVLP
ncbi:MAG: hypothetical protein RR065_00950 [Clostridia bacterium]